MKKKKLTIKITDKMHEELKIWCIYNQITMTEFIIKLIMERLR